jgi:hypothetical protein
MKPNIGGNIRKLRLEKQVTQEQLAARLLVSCQAVILFCALPCFCVGGVTNLHYRRLNHEKQT